MKKDRATMTKELIQMGFHRSHKGFNYILDAVDIIQSTPDTCKVAQIYQIIGDKYNVKYKSVERDIRHSIEKFYYDDNDYPAIFYPNADTGTLPNKEFLYRLVEYFDNYLAV